MPVTPLPQADCYLNLTQEFLVCTTIHKAKNLAALNADTYVRVRLGKTTKVTKVFRGSENPYYNEYFVFELSCTLAELLRLTVLYEVKKRTCCKTHPTLGELLIDLHTVWNQPHKSFYKKWGKLESCISNPSTADVRGHLQVDLAIVSPNQPAVPILTCAGDTDDIESNLLQNLDMPPCNIRYHISLYSGVFLKKTDYTVQVSLAGMNGKTRVCKGTPHPEWNEEIQFNWTYPSLSQTFLLQVMCHEGVGWKPITESEIYLDEISFNAAPSLGPTFMHFYDCHNYIGRVLLEITSEKLIASKETIGRKIAVQSTAKFSDKNWWTEENFVLEFLTWQGEFIHASASNMKMVMKFAEHTSDNLECFLKNYSNRKSYSTHKYFNQASPFKAIHINCSIPDNRLKYEVDQFMFMLAEQMRSEMENFKLFQLKYPQDEAMHCKCLKAIILTILGTVQDQQHFSRMQYNGFKQQTTWDENRFAFLREFFSRLTASLNELRHNLKAMRDGESACDKVYQELQQLRGQIESIMQTRIQDEWPELQLHMCLSGGKAATNKFAVCKLNARHFVFSQRGECTGRWCGVPRNFVFKDTDCVHTCRNCGCLKGVVYGWLRVATESEQTEFSFSVDWEQKERFYYQPKVAASHFICRVYVHQAKIQPGADNTGLCDASLRIVFGDQMLQTSTIAKSLAPVWNETLAFAVRDMPGPVSWYEKHPPLLPIEMFDVDKLKTQEYMGCGLVELAISNNVIRKDPLKSVIESINATSEHDLQGDGDENSKPVNRLRSNSAILNLKRLVKTRVALQQLRELKNLSPPTLKWMPIANLGASRVEILMSGELLQVNDNETPDGPEPVVVEGIPKEIKPIMGKYLLEVTFIGLRNCQRMSSSSLGRYKIHVMMGELLLKSGISGSGLKNSINFLENFASGVVYWPPIIATQIDCPGHNREVTLGATLISDPSKYLSTQEATCDLEENCESSVIQVVEDEESAPLLPDRTIQKESFWTRTKKNLRRMVPRRLNRHKLTPRLAVDDSEYNWWTKFYNSLYMQEQNIESSSKHKIVIYGSELEKESDFSFLTDWAEPFHLIHGVKIKKNKPPKEEVYATLKMHIKLSYCTCNNASSVTLGSALGRMSSKLQSLSAMNEEIKVMVRVYLVQGMNFRSHDAHSQSDSYVKLSLGAQVISDRANCIRNQSNPIYGKRFQMPATIPREHILQISVYDRGGANDDLIGSTFIDLEDRVKSKHRATVGIANEFNRAGYNAWRDVVTPFEILKELCKKNNLGQPKFNDSTVELEGVIFEDSSVISTDEDLQERLSLTVLKNLHLLPSAGYRIVPEHVETRSLYRTDRPGVEQGKLQLWIEIFDASNVPPPIDITPSPARMFELRIVVYNCVDVPLKEKNVFGTNMSDIYIKAWCEDRQASQKTDVHYRSLTGEGSFNWRMIFPLMYSPVEDMMVIKRKGGFFETYETKQPPIIYFQIWEDDMFSSDDFMAAMDLCLSHFPEPFATSSACTERTAKKKRKSVNLFREKSVRGWFPCKGPSEKDDCTIAGKLELGLEILSDKDAATMPAGLGRNPPNALPPPDRPDTSFNPWKSPLKSVKHILLPALKKFVRYFIAILLIAVVAYILIQDIIQELLRRI